MKIAPEIHALHSDLTEWRQHIHAHPELAFEELQTAAFVAEKLASFGIAVTTGVGRTGVVGTLRNGDGPSIGLRADMDALPMQEVGNPPYKSKHDGVFHGCGHDGHTAMLLGTARHLAETRGFAGTVHFIFQPAEEGQGGGQVMIDDGLFERFPCEVIYGLHNWPGLAPGHAAVRPGPIMAAADMFDLEVIGKGGHAAFPHDCVDPVVVAAQIITALQTLVSRRTRPTDTAVISVCQVHGGSAHNVIPDRVKLAGTVRTLLPETRARMEPDIRRLGQNIAEAMGATAELNWMPTYPPTVNHAGPAETAARVAEQIFGAANVHTDLPPSMGAEDFSFMLEARPGAYLWLGSGGGVGGCGLHNARFDFNDDVLPYGVAWFSALVRDALP